MRDENKVVFYGVTSVGKSSLLLRLVKDKFIVNSESTIGASFCVHNREIECKGQKKIVSLSIWDTAGQERFHSLAPMYIRGAKVVILCFQDPDIKIIRKKKKYIETVDSIAKIFFVATKVDDSSEIKVFDELSKELEDKIYCTSAKTGYGVNKLFDDIGEYVYSHLRSVKFDDKTLGNITIDFRNEMNPSQSSVFDACKFW